MTHAMDTYRALTPYLIVADGDAEMRFRREFSSPRRPVSLSGSEHDPDRLCASTRATCGPQFLPASSVGWTMGQKGRVSRIIGGRPLLEVS
jgi:hypothetical protein